ncbi:MAG: hypothetical protein KA185_14165, partial [Vitreoscilla sp.]|nr:hypothetical protein [Vitreoscilla sp.]
MRSKVKEWWTGFCVADRRFAVIPAKAGIQAFALIRGWLAKVWAGRLRRSKVAVGFADCAAV